MATIPNLNITVPNANVPDQESDEDIDKVDVKYFEVVVICRPCCLENALLIKCIFLAIS